MTVKGFYEEIRPTNYPRLNGLVFKSWFISLALVLTSLCRSDAIKKMKKKGRWLQKVSIEKLDY